MSVPRQSSIWDERRNTSQVHLPPPTAVNDALKALRKLRMSAPRFVRWLEEGAPAIHSDKDHYLKFGKPYKQGDL